MAPYQLAKIIDWAGHIDTRKRLQKLVFMLQAAGCKLDASFFLHRFGPYSQDVAEITDKLVNAGILNEVSESNAVGRQFAYTLSEPGSQQLAEVEKNPKSQAILNEMSKFKPLISTLIAAELWELEVASTIAYFHNDFSFDWDQARKRGCNYKSVDPDSSFGKAAESLAQEVVNLATS